MRSWNKNIYRNPKIYTLPRKKTQISFNPVMIKSVIFVIVFIAIYWFLFFSSYFKIKNIEINGTLNEEVKKTIDSFYQKNILIFKPDKVEKDLLQKQTSIESIKIFRGLPDTLKIFIKVREPKIGWKSQEKYYFIDEQGYIFQIENRDLTADYLTKIPVIEDTKNVDVVLGHKFITKDFLDFVSNMSQSFIKIDKFKVIAFKVQETTFQIDVETDAGFKIIFNTTGNLDKQMEALIRTLETKMNEVHEYIDLRIEGRVYYK